MNEPKLERCPHCGGIAKLEDWTCAWESGTTIRCTVCGAVVSEGVDDGNGWHDRAVEKWNRRAPLPDNKALTVDEAIAWGAGLIEANTDAHVVFCAECGFPIADYGVDKEIHCSWCRAKNTSCHHVDTGPGYCTTSIDRKAKTFDQLFASKRRPPEKGE